jgi:hypothetical protein
LAGIVVANAKDAKDYAKSAKAIFRREAPAILLQRCKIDWALRARTSPFATFAPS